MEKGRENRVMELMERGVVALERLNDEVKVEIDPGPPICPHCGAEDPQVQTPGEDSTRGPLSEIVILCRCEECGETMYVVVESYSMHRSIDTIRDELFYSKNRRAGSRNEQT